MFARCVGALVHHGAGAAGGGGKGGRAPKLRRNNQPHTMLKVPERMKHNNSAADMSDDEGKTRLAGYLAHLKKYNKTDIIVAKKLWLEWQRLVAEEGCMNGFKTFNFMLHSVINLRDEDLVMKIWSYQKANPTVLTPLSYSLMLTYYAKVRDARGQAAVMQHMAERGVHPDARMFTSVVRCQVLLKDLTAAKDAFQEILGRGLEPEASTYTTLISALPFEEAVKYVRMMQKRGHDVTSVYVLQALIEACGHSKDPARAEAIFAAARPQPPPATMYRKMLYLYTQLDDATRAFEIFTRAKAAGVRVDLDAAAFFTTYLKKRARDYREQRDRSSRSQKSTRTASEGAPPGGATGIDYPGTPAPLTPDDCVDLAAKLFAMYGEPSSYLWLRELIRLADAARRPDVAQKYVGVCTLANIAITPHIQECLDRLGIGDLQSIDVQRNRGRSEKTWYPPPQPASAAPARRVGQRPQTQHQQRSTDPAQRAVGVGADAVARLARPVRR